MRFLVISDTHGDISKAIQIYEATKNIDKIIHLGDYEQDAHALRDALSMPNLAGVEVISVKGNCDDYFTDDYKILETEAGRVLLTHGHKQKVKTSPQSMLYLAMELDCKAALFGHTHIPFYAIENGICLLNPGSLTKPHFGGQGSYAVLTTSKQGFCASILYYDEDEGANERHVDLIMASEVQAQSQTQNPARTQTQTQKKPRGGYLKGLLNHSDRF